MKNTPIPDKFTVTITEEDRQNAFDFCDNGECLMATAVKRMFPHATVDEFVSQMRIEGTEYSHEHAGTTALYYTAAAIESPFYGPEVVGKTFTFTREKE